MKRESKILRIERLLDLLDETNKMLRMHRQSPEPSRNSIENYTHLRADFMRQLAALLKEFEVEIQLPLAA